MNDENVAERTMFWGTCSILSRIRKKLVLLAFLLSALTAVCDPLFAQSVDSLSQLQQIQNALQAPPTADNTSSDKSRSPDVILQPANPPSRMAGELPPSRLEQIMSGRAGVALRQFGYDFLGVGSAVVVPQVGAIQDDYILGPGDTIVVSLRGQENSEYRETIDRNGQVTLPRISPILAAGRTLGQLRQDVTASVRAAYISTQSFVSLGGLRQISVTVSGEVNSPGTRLVTGLSSPLDAILLSGGIKKTGSLRNVKLVHGNAQTTIDLYSIITQHGTSSQTKLTDGDRIVVTPLGPTVAIAGWLRRPGIYELAPGTGAISVRQAISLAGGLEVRGRYRLSVLRIEQDGSTKLTALASEIGTLRDGETMFAQPAADQVSQSATLSGNTPLAGRYAVGGATSLSQVLKQPGALGQSPYTLFGVIVRQDPVTKAISLIAFSPSAVLESRQDIALGGHDLVRVFTTREALLLSADIEEFKRQLEILDQKNRAPLEFGQTASAQNGLGATDSSELSERQIVAALTPKTLGEGGVLSDHLPTNEYPIYGLTHQQTQYLANATPSVSLRSNDISEGSNQSFNQIPSQNSSPNDGSNPAGASFAGRGSGTSQPSIGSVSPPAAGKSLSEIQPSAALPVPRSRANQVGASDLEQQSINGTEFPSNLEIETFGQLARQLGLDPLILMHFLNDNCISVRGSVLGGGYYLIGSGATIHNLVASIGGLSNQTDINHFELIANSASPTDSSGGVTRRIVSLEDPAIQNYELHPRDEIRFNPIDTTLGAGTVTLQGQVRFPGIYNIERGERLSELLLRAGGLTDVSYPYGTVFLRKSVAEAEHQGNLRQATEIRNIIASGISRIGTDKLSAESVPALNELADRLRDAPALGRVSVIADPVALAANPSRDPLLESGDVVYIPQRPSTISVLGQVNQPGTFMFSPDASVDDYVEQAGGYGSLSDKSETFIIFPDGTARKADTSWLSFGSASLPPGTTIVVQRDPAPLDARQLILDISGILQSLAISAASLAVIHNN
jgi:protein involved in polysaccharide export with SLBB domain